MNPSSTPVHVARPGGLWLWARACRNKVWWFALPLLIVLAASCQAPQTNGWTPLYLQARVCAGKAQIQWQGSSEWTAVANSTDLVFEQACQVIADPVEGVRLCLADGSELELAAGTSVGMQDLGVFPRLQTRLDAGKILFVGQKPSYQFIVPECSAELASTPTRIRLEVNGTTGQVAVEEGSAQCATKDQTVTLQACMELISNPGNSVEIRNFCTPPTATLAPIAMPTAAVVPGGATATATSTPIPSTPAPETPTATPVTPTATPTPTPTIVVATRPPTATPVPPTPTPVPPATQKPQPPPPPTNTPVPPTPVPPTPVPPTPTTPPPPPPPPPDTPVPTPTERPILTPEPTDVTG